MRGTLGVLVVCCLALAVSVAAAPPKAFKAEVQGAGSVLALNAPVKGAVGAYLVVVGPNDFRVEKAFTGSESIAVNLSQIKDAQGQPVAFADGDYKWELRVNTPSAEGVAETSAVQVPESSVLTGPKSETWVSSGWFKVHGGGITPVVEGPKNGTTPITAAVQSSGGVHAGATGMTVTPQTFNADNFYIGGTGLCVGCVNNDGDLAPPEILLKGADPYLTAHDTLRNLLWRWSNFSTSTLLKLQMEDDNSGGTDTRPVGVEFNAPTNTLYVAKSGIVGIGTSTPSTGGNVQGLDIVQPIYPAVRLNRSGSANNFDLWANCCKIGIFDETANTNPFVIYQGAPSYSLMIAASGNVGIGTITPTHPLHAWVNGSTDPVLMLEGANQSDALSLKVQHPNAVIGFGLAGGAGSFFAAAARDDAVIFSQPGKNLLLGPAGSEAARISATGKVGIGMTAPTHLLDVGVSGAYCNGGAWVDGSSREYKQDIEELSSEAAEEALEQLSPVTYVYKAMPDEHHVGFIAEDVPELVATPDRKGLSAMDVVAVLTKVVQEQQAKIQGQKSLLEEQQKAIAELSAKVAALEQKR